MLRWGLLVAALLLPGVARAQNYIRIPTCGTASPVPGASTPYMDANGNICVYTSSAGGATSTNLTQIDGTAASTGAGATGAGSLRTTTAQDPTTIAGSAPGTAGTPSAQVVTVQGATSGGAPVPVTVSSAAGPAPLSYSASTIASVTTSSGPLITAGAYTHSLTLQDNSNLGNVWLNITCGTAVVGSGIVLPAGHGGFVFGSVSNPVPTACITAISDNGTASVSIAGG
jgi:hypothetical protein